MISNRLIFILFIYFTAFSYAVNMNDGCVSDSQNLIDFKVLIDNQTNHELGVSGRDAKRRLVTTIPASSSGVCFSHFRETRESGVVKQNVFVTWKDAFDFPGFCYAEIKFGKRSVPRKPCPYNASIFDLDLRIIAQSGNGVTSCTISHFQSRHQQPRCKDDLNVHLSFKSEL